MTIARSIARSIARGVASAVTSGSSGGPSGPSGDPLTLELSLDWSEAVSPLITDTSSNAYPTVQGTAGSRPSIVEGLNSLSAAQFDGVDDFLTVGDASSFNFLHNGSAAYVVAVVAFGEAAATPNTIYTFLDNAGFGSAAGYTLFYDDDTATNGLRSLITNDNGSASDDGANNVITPGTFYILENLVDADNATVADRNKLYLNGSALSTSNFASGPASVSDAYGAMRIGAANDDFLFAVMKLHELRIYRDYGTPADRAAIRSALATKYGISL